MHLCPDATHSIFDVMINQIEDDIPKINIAKMTLSNILVMVLTHSSHNSNSHNESLVSYHPSEECFMVMDMGVPNLPSGQVNC